MTTETPASVIAFWFGDEADDRKVAEQKSSMWWAKNDAVDKQIAARFEASVLAAASGGLDAWAATPEGRLALVLLTDQFPRNIYRGQAQSFAFDDLALRWTLEGIAQGVDKTLRLIQRVFFYLPLEHAEFLSQQDHAVRLFNALLQEVPDTHKDVFAGFRNFAILHRNIIARFGRFPHRNAILGRLPTDAEITFLKTPGSSF